MDRPLRSRIAHLIRTRRVGYPIADLATRIATEDGYEAEDVWRLCHRMVADRQLYWRNGGSPNRLLLADESLLTDEPGTVKAVQLVLDEGR